MMINSMLIAGFAVMMAGLLVVAVTGIYTVGFAEAAVVTRFGRFRRVVATGTHWKMPIDRLAWIANLRASQMNLKMGTRTKDNVIITIPITIETRMNPEMVFEAWAKLPDPGPLVQDQARKVVAERLRSLTLNELFASQTGIAGTLKRALDDNLKPLGYDVVRVQVTGAVPNNLEDAQQYTGRLVQPDDGPYTASPLRSRVA